MRKFDKDFRKWLKQTNLFDIWERIPHEFRQDIYFTFFRENEIYLEMNEGYWLEDECWVNIYYDKQTEDIEFGGLIMVAVIQQSKKENKSTRKANEFLASH